MREHGLPAMRAPLRLGLGRVCYRPAPLLRVSTRYGLHYDLGRYVLIVLDACSGWPASNALCISYIVGDVSRVSMKLAADTARQCPWCGRWALKDRACNHVVCGRDARGFHVGTGCGRQYCFLCARRLCGRVYDPRTGRREVGVSESHQGTAHNPTPQDPCSGPLYCPGGHNSHK